MTDDLKKRLREGITLYSACLENPDKHMTLLSEAADRIEQLEAEVERLKTTPPDKREDLRCVISDLCRQVRDAEAERDKLKFAIENIRLFAARNRKEDWALLILGFCAEGGVVGSMTR